MSCFRKSKKNRKLLEQIFVVAQLALYAKQNKNVCLYIGTLRIYQIIC